MKAKRITAVEIARALRASGGNRTRAAEQLGISPRTLGRRIDADRAGIVDELLAELDARPVAPHVFVTPVGPRVNVTDPDTGHVLFTGHRASIGPPWWAWNRVIPDQPYIDLPPKWRVYPRKGGEEDGG